MSDAYERVKGGRLTFKGGALASRSKDIDKKKKKKKKNNNKSSEDNDGVSDNNSNIVGKGGEEIYTIDPMKKMKYDELFPVESKKFGYDPLAKSRSVEEALDDRVKKKADRYCK